MEKRPMVSVIIPSYNRLDILPRTLQALTQQTVEKDFYEVMVIDDGSTDGSMDFLSHFMSKTELRFHLHRQHHEGAGAARNWGVENGVGQYLIFLDADIIAATDLVQRHYERLADAAAVPRVWMGCIDTSAELDLQQGIRRNEFFIHTEDMRPTPLPWYRYRTPNSSMSMELIRRASGFDPRFEVAEDVDLAYRLAAQGVEFHYDPGIHGVHYHPLSLVGYKNKAEQYGRAMVQWYDKYPQDRTEMAFRYGVWIKEMPLLRKIRHAAKALLINRFSTPILERGGLLLHRRRWKGSIRLISWVYRFHLRKTFTEGRIRRNERMD